MTEWSNCWIFALRKWWAAGTARSYLIIRKSRHSWVPHVMWAPSIENLYVEEYKPVQSHFGQLTRWFPLVSLFFRGRARCGVGEEKPRKNHGST